MQNLDPAPEPTTITVNQEAQVQCYESNAYEALSVTMPAQIKDGKCKCCFCKTTGEAMERPAFVC